ncbi:hypothetical protein C2L65_31545 [Paraburkholderia terrae]|uniref:Uncharacterized protein n=2 Tax=Paraburkholderia terrae TaxID=311230 RepID=A0A2I8F4Q3_9BURK|nr:hypothetical protein C2L65_31545 [Paraburkholderia terrae]
MRYIFRIFVLIILLFIHLNSSDAKFLAITSNHLLDHIEIDYAHDGCSFLYSPVNFCDERHIVKIKQAIANRSVNFNGHYILLKIKEWRQSDIYGDSVVVIDALTGIVYPMPFDYFSGRIDMGNSQTIRKPRLTFSGGSNRVCIDGSILVYRATTNGTFCFDFDGSKFNGYRTEYMN